MYKLSLTTIPLPVHYRATCEVIGSTGLVPPGYVVNPRRNTIAMGPDTALTLQEKNVYNSKVEGSPRVAFFLSRVAAHRAVARKLGNPVTMSDVSVPAYDSWGVIGRDGTSVETPVDHFLTLSHEATVGMALCWNVRRGGAEGRVVDQSFGVDVINVLRVTELQNSFGAQLTRRYIPSTAVFYGGPTGTGPDTTAMYFALHECLAKCLRRTIAFPADEIGSLLTPKMYEQWVDIELRGSAMAAAQGIGFNACTAMWKRAETFIYCVARLHSK
eukprot:PhM_4_TR1894/c0_g1_i1/m.38041